MGDAELIVDDEKKSIWLIDVENKYWYFRLHRSLLVWNYNFFSNFFMTFSMTEPEFKPIMIELIERILKRDIAILASRVIPYSDEVEDLLKRMDRK